MDRVVPITRSSRAHRAGARLDFRMLTRTHLGPTVAMPAIRAVVHEFDPNLPLGDVATMEHVRDRTLLTFSQAGRPGYGA